MQKSKSRKNGNREKDKKNQWFDPFDYGDISTMDGVIKNETYVFALDNKGYEKISIVKCAREIK